MAAPPRAAASHHEEQRRHEPGRGRDGDERTRVLYEEESEMREAFRRWGPPRVGGDFWEYAPVTEQNPLVLPGMEEPDNPAAPFWPYLIGEYHDLCMEPLGDD